MITVLVLVGALAGLLLYFLPTMVASNRRHRNKLAIAMLNLFLGWCLIGWVIALVWASTKDVEPPQPPLPPAPRKPWEGKSYLGNDISIDAATGQRYIG